jgi:hypothetical protein
VLRWRRISSSAWNQSSSGDPPCLPRASHSEYASSAIRSLSEISTSAACNAAWFVGVFEGFVDFGDRFRVVRWDADAPEATAFADTTPRGTWSGELELAVKPLRLRPLGGEG